MPEQNAAQALQEWIHEMIAQRKAGHRAGAGGDANGEMLWLYFSRGDAIESRIVFRAGMRDGKPVVLVDRVDGEVSQILTKLPQPDEASLPKPLPPP